MIVAILYFILFNLLYFIIVYVYGRLITTTPRPLTVNTRRCMDCAAMWTVLQVVVKGKMREKRKRARRWKGKQNLLWRKILRKKRGKNMVPLLLRLSEMMRLSTRAVLQGTCRWHPMTRRSRSQCPQCHPPRQLPRQKRKEGVPTLKLLPLLLLMLLLMLQSRRSHLKATYAVALLLLLHLRSVRNSSVFLVESLRSALPRYSHYNLSGCFLKCVYGLCFDAYRQ